MSQREASPPAGGLLHQPCLQIPKLYLGHNDDGDCMHSSPAAQQSLPRQNIKK